MTVERTIQEWFTLRDSLAETLEDYAGEEAVRGLSTTVEAQYTFEAIAEQLIRGGWVTDWPSEEG